MSRFVISDGLRRGGTGARKNLDSFPDPGKVTASPPRSAYCAIVLSVHCNSAYLSALPILSVHKRILQRMEHKKRKLFGKQARCREEDSTMSPPSDDSDPDPLSLFPHQFHRRLLCRKH